MKRSIQVLAVLLLAISLLAGCGAKKTPTMKVRLEQQGKDIVVYLDITDFEIGKTGHAHLQLDSGPEMMPAVPKYTFQNVSPGKHVVKAALSDVNHKDLNVTTTAEIETK